MVAHTERLDNDTLPCVTVAAGAIEQRDEQPHDRQRPGRGALGAQLARNVQAYAAAHDRRSRAARH